MSPEVGADSVSACGVAEQGEAGSRADANVERFVYRNKRVEILHAATPQGDPARICVDGRPWPSDLIGRVGDGYSSRLLPFKDFSDLRALIEALIDNDGVLYRL